VSVALAALIVGSTLAVDPGGASPFGPARWWVISTLALLGGGLALRDGDRRLHRPTIVLWAALLALLTAAALAGDDVRVALLGHPVRHLGVITWLLFALLFVAGQQLGGDADRRVLVRGVALATAGIGLWCAWELTVGRPVDVGADTDRLLGPFGSAAMLGAGTALLVPPAVGLALDTTERRAGRAVAAIGGVLGVTALVGSGSRAALVGIAVAGVVLLVRNHSNVVGQRSPGRRRPTTFVVGGAVVALALVAPRLGEVFDRTEGASSRFDEWSLAFDVIADHPVLGVGPEGYRIAAVGTVDADYERSYGRDRVLPDRAHSGPLDVALDGGVLAALMHLTLVCSVLALALHRSRGARPTATGLVVGLLAYAVQQLLLFPLAELDGIWWLLAGTAVAAPTPAPTRALRRVGTAALVLAPVALVAGLLGVAADRLAHRAVTDADRPARRRGTRRRPSGRPAARRPRAPLVRGAPAPRARHARRRRRRDRPGRRGAAVVAARPDRARRQRNRAARSRRHHRRHGRRRRRDRRLARAGRARSGAGALADRVRPCRRARRRRRHRTSGLDCGARAATRRPDGGGSAACAGRRGMTADDVEPNRGDGCVPDVDFAIDRTTGDRHLVEVSHVDDREALRFASFEDFYLANRASVGRALALTLRDDDLARDAVDEAMARAYQRWSHVGQLENPGGWVYRVGLNWSRSVVRRLRRPTPIWIAQPTDTPAPAVQDPAIDRALDERSTSTNAPSSSAGCCSASASTPPPTCSAFAPAP
jgi:O-antigen ligase